MDAAILNGFISSHSEGFHSASPSSSSRDSNAHSPHSDSPTSSPALHHQQQPFRPLTPPGFDNMTSGSNINSSPPKQTNLTVTPPKSPSPSPLPSWDHNSDGIPSPEGSNADGDEEPGLRTPAVNSHGKVKTFKCKQCEFVAVTKLDFWDHTKTHIKPERMLTCPKCPFVTEYKHHLEYHMRNHFGSKPFQCSQCSYSCVNKSMLNSHLKSHSNIYQYRCADCNYATKYCHSLKLHLRKYQHRPDIVLNQDGTPNPLPIIDVYGTRRGPKQRPHGKQVDESPLNQSHSIFQNPFAMNFPYGSLLQHPMLFSHNNNLHDSSLLSKSLEFRDNALNNNNNIPITIPSSNSFSPKFVSAYSAKSNSKLSEEELRQMNYQEENEGSPPPSMNSSEIANDALDLTNSNKMEQVVNTPPMTPTAMIKSRRKGKAFKLDRNITRTEQNEEIDQHVITPDLPFLLHGNDDMDEKIDVTYEPVKVKFDKEKETKALSTVENESSTKVKEADTKESYDCHYCDIVFKDIIMYTMHMGYHGFKDPFTCNMCGHQSADKVSFFVHIARSQHS